ncbi:MAG: gamma-glutamyltransferase family protein [Pseudomonadota bacterium]
MHFTTRPDITGSFGVCTSTHWIASSVGMKMLEAGGNAFDAAVAMGFALQVLEPHLVGPGGDLPAIFYSKREDKVRVICAQGPAPAGATIDHYRAEGMEVIPDNGLLATVIPGAFDGWMRMLRDYGRLPLADVLAPAIWYAEHGHPLLPGVGAVIAGLADFFRDEWPSSYDTWVPGGQVPQPGRLFRNPVLAETWTRILAEAAAKPTREAQIDAARDAFYRGFVAETMSAYLDRAEVMDASGTRHRGVLSADDLAGYAATIEDPLTLDYHGWTVAKCGPWTQGPVLLQSLALLAGIDLAAMDPGGADFVHTVTEAMKLAYADREVYYGDPAHASVPLEALLSAAYNADRRALIGSRASLDLRPGTVPGFEDQRARTLALLDRLSATDRPVYEPTMAHLSEPRGDTVHLDVIDAQGNVVSATPSGGWLQSSPVIPGLGFALNSRAQMFWLEEGLPTSLAPGRRPRTTLTPSLAWRGGAFLSFGTPGGDQQDQWQLSFFLRHVHHGQSLQQAIDAPLFHSGHFPASFYPRARRPGLLAIEESFGTDVLADLAGRGHVLAPAPPWSIGRMTAAARATDGILSAAATPRLMQAYAVGR